jgi:hypothetical protein
MPRLRTAALVAIVAILVASAAVAALGWYFYTRLDSDEDPFGLLFGGVILASLPVGLIHRQMRRRQESLVLPIVASALGMTYAKDARDFVRNLPPVLLPRGALSAEDHVTVLIGTRTIHLAEFRVSARGFQGRTLFQGVVLRTANRALLPPFLLAPVQSARPGIAFGNLLSTDGFRHLRDVRLRAGSFGLWVSGQSTSEPEALTKLVAAILDVERSIDPAYHLNAVASTGTETHFAFDHGRNLFHLGSLWPTEGRVLDAVQNAAQDFGFPLAFGQALIKAEADQENAR